MKTKIPTVSECWAPLKPEENNELRFGEVEDEALRAMVLERRE